MRWISEWNISTRVGGFTMIGGEVGFVMLHAAFPHELIYGSSPESLQEFGWALLGLSAADQFQAQEFAYSTATLGGRVPTEAERCHC